MQITHGRTNTVYLSLVSKVDFLSFFSPLPALRGGRKFQKSLTIVKDAFGNK